MSSSTSPRTAACPPARSYAAPVEHEELPVGRGQRRAAASARRAAAAASSPTATGPAAATSRSATPVGDRPRPGRDQVEPVPLQHGDRAGQGVGEQPHVGVDERQRPRRPRPARRPRPDRAGVRLAEPAGRGRPGRRPGGPGDRRSPRTTAAVAVGRAVVDDDHAEVVDPALVEQRGQAVADLRRLVADRERPR